ncbi:MAG TPA: TetR/AcrR family transcriptional regulator [Kineosporiaceae bacterium]|nr:TetR/AcrR family transcriptional regulator [Kineosporiaceae bacterium]
MKVTARPQNVTHRHRLPKAERIEQVLHAAAIEFAKTGYFGTTVEAIADRAGISQPYIFKLFGSKSALFSRVVSESFDALTGAMMSASEGLSGTSSLMAMGNKYRESLRDNPAVLIQLHAIAACSDPEIRAVVDGAFGRQWNAIAERSGANNVQIKVFVGLGRLLTDVAAIAGTESGPGWKSAVRTSIPRSLYDALETPPEGTG